jgi:hypothetical protein
VPFSFSIGGGAYFEFVSVCKNRMGVGRRIVAVSDASSVLVVTLFLLVKRNGL